MTFVTIIAATAMALLAILDLARRAEIARQLERSTLEARHRGPKHRRERTGYRVDNAAAMWRAES